MSAGVPPAHFTEQAAKGKSAVMPYLQRMNTTMQKYFKANTLMDVVLHSNAAEPVIVYLHDTWTEADKAALGMS